MIQAVIFWLLVTLGEIIWLSKLSFKDKVDEEDTSTWDQINFAYRVGIINIILSF